jgi:hypothetical protein
MPNRVTGTEEITIGTLEAALHNQQLRRLASESEPQQLILEPAEGTQAARYAREFLALQPAISPSAETINESHAEFEGTYAIPRCPLPSSR